MMTDSFDHDYFRAWLGQLVQHSNQRQVARAIGVGQPAISKLLNGDTKPSVETFARLIAWSNADPEAFIIRDRTRGTK